MMLDNEDQVLDQTFRVQVIKEIMGTDNQARKAESMRRYEIYKDQVKKYVLEGLSNEGLLPKTVQQMSNRCANISIARKIVNKLARTYSAGVIRSVMDGTEATKKDEPIKPKALGEKEPDLKAQIDPEAQPKDGEIDPEAELQDSATEQENEEATKQVNDYAKLMKFDEKMKKGDRYRELQKNMMFQIVPEQVGDEDIYRIAMRTLLPWHYDVLEDARDNEVARCVILSDYSDDCGQMSYSAQQGGSQGYHDDGQNDQEAKVAGLEKDHIFIWWTDKYHFRTNSAGAYIADPENAQNQNPIEMLPFVNNADDQDGYFWAVGGDDLIDGTILLNKIITDMFFIAYHQGWGQLVITGKNLKDDFITGVNNALILNYDEGEPEPKVSILSASPPLDQWLRTIEQYMALLLTTNNLSTANVSMKLDASTFPSGIAMLVERSEATDDISDKQVDYQSEERQIWRIIAAWHNEYLGHNQLDEEYAAIGKMPDDLEVTVKFNEAKPVISEKEKLEALKLRKDLGINEEIDLIMMDNPGMSKEDAEKKLLAIKKQKLENMNAFDMPLKHGVQNGEVPQEGDHSGGGTVPGGAPAVADGGPGNDPKNGNKTGRFNPKGMVRS